MIAEKVNFVNLMGGLAETGKCVKIPEICPTLYEPVCGCNGKTYTNECVMKINKVSKNRDGLCIAEEAYY